MRSNPERDKLTTEIAGLRDKVADLETEIRKLGRERGSLTQVTDLERQVEKLKLEKDRLVEDNDRKIRETEHKTGLLKIKQDHDVEHARRMAQLEVRESNLDADRKRFGDEVKFQREHMQREVDRFDGIAKALMERLPVIEVELAGPGADPEGGRVMESSGLWSSSATTYTYPLITSGSSGSTFGGAIYAGGNGVPYAPEPPGEPAPLEWLDAEVESVCKLARAA